MNSNNSFSHIQISADVTRFKDFTEDPPSIPNTDHKIGQNYNYATRGSEITFDDFLVYLVDVIDVRDNPNFLWEFTTYGKLRQKLVSEFSGYLIS